MDKKYKLTNEFIINSGKKLYRIEALKDFANVKKGDKGGFVEKEENLSQTGDCWIYNDAIAMNNALICGNAQIRHYARVYENAIVKDYTYVVSYATIHDNAQLTNFSVVGGFAEICGNTVLRYERIGGKVIIGERINDKVNKPSHYAQDDIGYLYGNIQKYIRGFKSKSGLEDLKKARVYLNLLIDELDNK